LKHVRNLKYEENVAFIDRFQDDFADIIKSYVGDDGRVFIFIDDLDRCEVPRAAQLLQAINLLLSAEQGNLFFILGLDREMVAAGLAAKNKDILPYLAAGRHPASGKLEIERVGIEYAYYFMEKFIQVPFRVPHPDERDITDWVSDLASDKGPRTKNPVQQIQLNIHEGDDPEDFEEIVDEIAKIFRFNPRRLKQFVNVFRLRLMIALSTNVLVPAQKSEGGERTVGASMHQIGLFTAILIHWPSLIGDLVEEPSLIDRIYKSGDALGTDIDDKWSDVRKSIDKIDKKYSLEGLDISPLLTTMPDAYSGTLAARSAKQARSTLVPGLGAQSAGNTSFGEGRAFFGEGTTFHNLEAGVSATSAPVAATGASGGSIAPPSSRTPSRRVGPRRK
jgi:hypothetical protein